MEELLTPAEIAQVKKQWGLEAYKRLMGCVAVWQLTGLKALPPSGPNALFLCTYQGQPTMLKLAPANEENTHSAAALAAYNGRGLCRLYTADAENGALLMARILPGTPLRAEPAIDERLRVFTTLFKHLHIPPPVGHTFPTYTGWVGRITDFMPTTRAATLTKEMQAAHAAHQRLATRYNSPMLLHGDLHHDNILKNENGGYTIIDPKGVVGDKLFDTPRFLLNEFFFGPLDEAARRRTGHALTALSPALGYPHADLATALYTETAMACCWFVESGAEPGEWPRLLERVLFAKSFL